MVYSSLGFSQSPVGQRKCPQGRILRPARPIKHGRFFYSKANDCARCPLRGDYLSKGQVNKAVVVGYDYPAPLRVRRPSRAWADRIDRLSAPPLALRGLPRDWRAPYGAVYRT